MPFGKLGLGLGLGNGRPAPSGGGNDGGGGDPYWENVVFLSSFDGVDGATTATDDSNSAHAMTFNGNAQIDTTQSKFGGGSLLLDGTGDYLSMADSADWSLSAANSDQFTIECFIRPHEAKNMAIVSKGDWGPNHFSWELYFTAARQLSFTFASNGASRTNLGAGGTVMTLDGDFYHVAADKDSSGKIRLYVGGVMVKSLTSANSSFFDSTEVLYIGSDYASLAFNGWIDEVRITKGVARYASDAGFTVPTEAFPRS